MRYLIICLLFIISGCAHATIHDQCITTDAQAHYRDYDECYAEKAAAIERRRRVFASFGNRSQQQTNCTTIYSGGFASTRCY